MSELTGKVYELIRRENLILPGDTVIAGVSGGADSVCMLCVLLALRDRIRFALRAVHVEHGLRGEESTGDEEFVRALCDKLQVPLSVCRIRLREEAERRGLSLEEAGRAARRELFLKECGRIGNEGEKTRISLAHTMNDQAETILFHAARGTGLRGLSGIAPERGKFIHPMLGVTREEIEEYLRSIGQSWRTDRTNLENEYTRNRIRNTILPLFTDTVNRETVLHLGQLGARARMADEYLEDQARRKCEGMITREAPEDQICLNLASYLGEPDIIRIYMLRVLLEQVYPVSGLKDIGYKHLDALDDLAAGSCGREIRLPEGRTARKEKNRICIAPDEADDPGLVRKSGERNRERFPDTAAIVPIEESGLYHFGELVFRAEFLTEKTGSIQIPAKTYTKWLCCDTITETLTLRTRQQGDYLTVNAQGGRKKLKEYFIEEKIPAHERDHIVLLAEGKHILWVLGHRISEDVKVSGSSTRILKISCVSFKE